MSEDAPAANTTRARIDAAGGRGKTMKHFAPETKHLRAAVPVVGMAALLMQRKAALETMIREKHRLAREEDGAPADVKQLGAELRKVKRQLEAAKGAT
jgi:hypothetical protein